MRRSGGLPSRGLYLACTESRDADYVKRAGLDMGKLCGLEGKLQAVDTSTAEGGLHFPYLLSRERRGQSSSAILIVNKNPPARPPSFHGSVTRMKGRGVRDAPNIRFDS